MEEGNYVESLISEYSALLNRDPLKNPPRQYPDDRIARKLTKSADWTFGGAEELVRLVNDYDSFMLRNAPKALSGLQCNTEKDLPSPWCWGGRMGRGGFESPRAGIEYLSVQKQCFSPRWDC